jgi:hypothetical protein
MTFEPNPQRMFLLGVAGGTAWLLWRHWPGGGFALPLFSGFSGHERLVAFAMVIIALVAVARMLLR